MSEVVCFLIEPTDRARRSLRRYVFSNAPNLPPCTGPFKYHNAETPIAEALVIHTDERTHALEDGADKVEAFAGDPRWPTHCSCGYEFTAVDQWQIFWNVIYRRADGQALECTLRDAPAGAMYFADWYSDVPEWRGPDGRSILVVLPNGHPWFIDGRASNCDSPCARCLHPYFEHYPKDNAARAFECAGFQEARPHKCWVRHGTPPNLHVDKDGLTCGAGAGSILSGSYHGFLHHGKLVGA